MESGADWLQAISIAITAYFAVRGLRTWRTQMIGQRKFTVAEEALLTFAMCKLVIEEARSPMAFGNEGAQLMADAQVPEPDRERLGSFFTTLARLNSGKDHFAKLLPVQQIARIHLGQEAYEALNVIWMERSKVITGARMLITHHRHGTPPERSADHVRRMEARIWAGGDPNTPDEIQAALDAAEAALIAICNPVLNDTPTGSLC
jgi:hypothetical protein